MLGKKKILFGSFERKYKAANKRSPERRKARFYVKFCNKKGSP